MRLLACLVAALAALAATGAAHAGSDVTRLTITIWPEGQKSKTPARTWTLRCAPPGGTVPRPARACRALFANRSALEKPPRSRICTAIWGGPQVASIRGLVLGKPVRATIMRANGCEIHRWSRLAPLLPVRV